MTPEDLAAWLELQTWTFAKSMPDFPHEYVVRKHTIEPEKFDDIVTFIRENGYKQKWGSRTYTYFDVGPHQLWTMGDPLPKTWILNRAKKSDS